VTAVHQPVPSNGNYTGCDQHEAQRHSI